MKHIKKFNEDKKPKGKIVKKLDYCKGRRGIKKSKT